MSHETQNNSSDWIWGIVQLPTFKLYTVLTYVSVETGHIIIVRVKEEESSIHEFVFNQFFSVLYWN